MDTVIVSIEEEKDLLFIQMKQFISDIIGADIVDEIGVTKESNLTRDLEMDSIEIVAFAEKVKKQYGEKVDFAGWLSKMNLDQLINLNLNDVINYIVDANNSDR